MYKILVNNGETKWWEYGFSHHIMKRICFLMNDTNKYDYTLNYEIEQCLKLSKTFKTFKKCLMKTKQKI